MDDDRAPPPPGHSSANPTCEAKKRGVPGGNQIYWKIIPQRPKNRQEERSGGVGRRVAGMCSLLEFSGSRPPDSGVVVNT